MERAKGLALITLPDNAQKYVWCTKMFIGSVRLGGHRRRGEMRLVPREWVLYDDRRGWEDNVNDQCIV